MPSSILIKCLVTVFLHINYVPSQCLASWVKMRSSIYNEVDRFTNKRHSTTIGTIGLPRLGLVNRNVAVVVVAEEGIQE